MTQTYRPLAAALWMSGSIAGLTVVAIAGRKLHAGLNTFEIMFYRSLVGLAIVTLAALATGRTAELRPRLLGWHFLRNAFHFTGQNLWLYALALIPLAQLVALEFSYPILVALAAPFFLGERLTRLRLVVAMIGFAGILIVARPFGVAGISLGLAAAILCAFGFAGSTIVTKRLTRLTTVTAILFWLSLMQGLMGLAGAMLKGHVALPGSSLWLWVLAIGVSGIVAHLGLTTALNLAPATIVAPLDFLRLPVIAVVGMLLYGEPLDIWVLVGGAIIFGANWLNISAENRRADAPVSQKKIAT